LFPSLFFLFTSTPCSIKVFNFSFWFVEGQILEVAGYLILHSSKSSFSFSASYIEIKKYKKMQWLMQILANVI
jgi:hypothetical protein